MRSQFYIIAFTLLVLSLPIIFQNIHNQYYIEVFPKQKIEKPYYPYYFLQELLCIGNCHINLNEYSFLYGTVTPFIDTTSNFCQYFYPIIIPKRYYCDNWSEYGNCSINLTIGSLYIDGHFNINGNNYNGQYWIIKNGKNVFVYKIDPSNYNSYLTIKQNLSASKFDSITINITKAKEIRFFEKPSIPIGIGLLMPFNRINCDLYYSTNQNVYLTLANASLYSYKVTFTVNNNYSNVLVNVSLPTWLSDAYIIVYNDKILKFCYWNGNNCNNIPSNKIGVYFDSLTKDKTYTFYISLYWENISNSMSYNSINPNVSTSIISYKGIPISNYKEAIPNKFNTIFRPFSTRK